MSKISLRNVRCDHFTDELSLPLTMWCCCKSINYHKVVAVHYSVSTENMRIHTNNGYMDRSCCGLWHGCPKSVWRCTRLLKIQQCSNCGRQKRIVYAHTQLLQVRKAQKHDLTVVLYMLSLQESRPKPPKSEMSPSELLLSCGTVKQDDLAGSIGIATLSWALRKWIRWQW